MPVTGKKRSITKKIKIGEVEKPAESKKGEIRFGLPPPPPRRERGKRWSALLGAKERRKVSRAPLPEQILKSPG